MCYLFGAFTTGRAMCESCVTEWHDQVPREESRGETVYCILDYYLSYLISLHQTQCVQQSLAAITCRHLHLCTMLEASVQFFGLDKENYD